MGAQQNDVNYMGATLLNLGILGATIFPYQVKPPPGCVGMQIKLMSTGSTVQILPNNIAGGSVGGATAVINGYPLVATEMYPIPGPAAFYLGCTGSSATVAANFFFSAGGASLV